MGKFKRRNRTGRLAGTGIFFEGRYHPEHKIAGLMLRKVAQKYKPGIRHINPK